MLGEWEEMAGELTRRQGKTHPDALGLIGHRRIRTEDLRNTAQRCQMTAGAFALIERTAYRKRTARDCDCVAGQLSDVHVAPGVFPGELRGHPGAQVLEPHFRPADQLGIAAADRGIRLRFQR